MSSGGIIKCPDCNSPLGMNTSVCPYCYSSAPAGAPWKGEFSILGIVILVAVLGGTWALKTYYDIDVNEILHSSF